MARVKDNNDNYNNNNNNDNNNDNNNNNNNNNNDNDNNNNNNNNNNNEYCFEKKRVDRKICQPQYRTEKTLGHENRGNHTTCHWLHRNSRQKVC